MTASSSLSKPAPARVLADRARLEREDRYRPGEVSDECVDVTSEVGIGTTFTVTLPAPVAADDTQPDDDSLQAAGNSSRH